MIANYLIPFFSIFFLFIPLAFLGAVLYAVWIYRRYGEFDMARGLGFFLFIIYGCTLFYAVVFPLPGGAEATLHGASPLILNPLSYLHEIYAVEGFSPYSPSTYSFLLCSEVFWQVVLNSFLFIPLGFFLTSWWRRRCFVAVIWGVAVSLFCEITQLTAIFGLYSQPYRIFATGDILLNTLGTFVGALIGMLLPFAPLSPRSKGRGKKAGKAPKAVKGKGKVAATGKTQGKKGKHAKKGRVLFLRRFSAFLWDWLIIAVAALPLGSIFKLGSWMEFSWQLLFVYGVLVALFFLVIPCLCQGRSLGKLMLKLAVVDTKGKRPQAWQCLLRYGLLYYLALPSLYLAVIFNRLSYTVAYSWALTLLVGVFALAFATFGGQGLYVILKSEEKLLLHEKISHTIVIKALGKKD